MNLPNKLTVTRMVIAPIFFCWFFTVDFLRQMPVWIYATVMFLMVAVMELSDLVDGKIARKYNLVTDLGKVMDPFADVICHMTFFLCLVVSNIMPVWAFALILWREFFQCFMRMLLMGKGKPMAANIFGKSKTFLYALGSVFGLTYRTVIVAGCNPHWMRVCTLVIFTLAAVSSVGSFIIYLRNTIKSGVLSSLTR